jgi:hypothetical protein
MIDINKEAEEYLKQWDWAEDVNGLGCFIAGHNSKATQAKVLQSQIDLLTQILNHEDCPFPLWSKFNTEKLVFEKQLKQLQDETIHES